ncbi:hypothetical protein I302_104618 [Kwoniella bestiolae CBS 10118]|uniref:SP-RING-type domain-containing protein n=1 Tax=Kwoniella bestiolae CBS 10118 TaxID=1296100 RepID=A0A1B9GBS1_9TREE|nr:hypothetical protein I302_03325 [Kwoniella bestiolae CBS 10118]OCF28466.1 hypothetical protein I302_03325 [Kwoniella bestiolae CBS 10118]
MASQVVLQTDWDDYHYFVNDYIPKQTVPVLKLFASIIEAQSRMQCYVRSSDRKADVVSRIQDAFARLKAGNDLRTYGQIRLQCEQRGTPQYRSTYAPAPTFGGVPSSSHSHNSYSRPAAPATNGYASSSYNQAGPSRAGGSNWQTQNRPAPTLQNWKPNPMWKPIRALTSMEMLPDISHNENSHVRRERKTNFSIPNDVIEKLNYTRDHPNSHPRYAIRLFCTSSDHYKPLGMPALPGQPVPTNKAIPIEYPSNPDIMVDSYPLSFKEKGLRGKAGSAPPFDLEKSPNGLSRVPGRMTTVAMGHTGPTVGKKKDVAKRFFYQIVFTEMTTKETLINRLKGLVPTSVEASLAEFRRRQEEDDDIVVGTAVMSLKDPLAYMRMTRPVRSSKCTHIQCFDAQWWIESNTQHPQWHCPHCGKELQFPELIVDGYVLSILNACPDSVDDVILEPGGDWHTEDNKYGSADWLASHRTAAPSPVEKKPEMAPSPQSNGNGATSDNAISKRKIVELLSDSEDEDDEQPLSRTVNGGSRPLALPTAALPRFTPAATPATPATGGASSARSSIQPANDIIDLTLSDSEDEEDDTDEAPPPASQTYFQGPGAGYTNRNAVDSNPPLHSQSEIRGSAARPPSGGPTPAPAPERYVPSFTNGQGSAARGGGTWINPLERDPLPSNPRYGQIPPAGPRAGAGSGYGSNISSGSLSKRPRGNQWFDDERPNDPRHDSSSSSSSRPGGFSSYSAPYRHLPPDPRSLPPSSAIHQSIAPRPSSNLPPRPQAVNTNLNGHGHSRTNDPSSASSSSPSLRVTIPNPNFKGERSRPNTPLLNISNPHGNKSSPGRGDTDEASLELGGVSVSPNRELPLPIYNKFTAPRNGEMDNEDEDGTEAERSSDLGLGMDTMEENFWEGVLNGDIDRI